MEMLIDRPAVGLIFSRGSFMPHTSLCKSQWLILDVLHYSLLPHSVFFRWLESIYSASDWATSIYIQSTHMKKIFCTVLCAFVIRLFYSPQSHFPCAWVTVTDSWALLLSYLSTLNVELMADALFYLFFTISNWSSNCCGLETTWRNYSGGITAYNFAFNKLMYTYYVRQSSISTCLITINFLPRNLSFTVVKELFLEQVAEFGTFAAWACKASFI